MRAAVYFLRRNATARTAVVTGSRVVANIWVMWNRIEER
jgi:hypothetical protein